MLKPKLASEFEGELNSVLTDTIERIRRIKKAQGDEILVNELPNELYKWAFECEYTKRFFTFIRACLCLVLLVEYIMNLNKLSQMFNILRNLSLSHKF